MTTMAEPFPSNQPTLGGQCLTVEAPETRSSRDDHPVKAKRNGDIIDIRQHLIEFSILDDLMSMLQPGPGKEKKMPTLLLYDEAGLKLFEEITYLEEYYLTNTEIEILTRSASRMAERIPPGSIVLELGSGNLRKVNILLHALESAGKQVDYYALDLSLPELRRTLAKVPTNYKHVSFYGLHGTYDDGLAWLQRAENKGKPKCILSLGSSIGNFNRSDAADFLRGFSRILSSEDTMMIALDGCQDGDKVYHAYNDKLGVTHQFLYNGLNQANAILKAPIFKKDEWNVIGEYDAVARRHHAFYSPREEFCFGDISIKAGERVRVEESYKYSMQESAILWAGSELAPGATFSNPGCDYHVHMLSRPTFQFARQADQYAATCVPSLDDWREVWALWDTVTQGMIPKSELLSQPIQLRNPCIFYLGHIPTFLDIHLTRTTKGGPTEPEYYTRIFERGIDPDVDDPEKCHDHSEVPQTWPPLEEILSFQQRVRDRVVALYKFKIESRDRRVGRALWLAFEHEILHLETLLYMLLQSNSVLPPPGRVRPDFADLALLAEKTAVPNEWITVPESSFTVGLDDPDTDSGPDRYFGWDNEKPARTVAAPSFQAKARPITNQEYAAYLEKTHNNHLPASWVLRAPARSAATTNALADDAPSMNSAHTRLDGDSERRESPNGTQLNGSPKTETRPSGYTNGIHTNGSSSNGTYTNADTVHATGDETYVPGKEFLEGKFIRTVFGLVPLELALHWPVMASYDELCACAKFMNGRIPTLTETRAIYNFVNHTKELEADNVLTKRIAAVNGHLSNNGVEETPPSHHWPNGASGTEDNLAPDPRDLHIDLRDRNVGFQHWHPTPVTQNGNRLSGQGDMGGAWEWTSSVLQRHDGFEPMRLYPAYTEDFFDGKHNVVLGGSWATHPRIAGRKSFVNWYQRNYPYVWAGARLVRDL